MSNMIVRHIPKQDVQQMIKALRSAGFTVKQPSKGYYLCKLRQKETGDVVTLFSALIGTSGYLVRMQADLFA